MRRNKITWHALRSVAVFGFLAASLMAQAADDTAVQTNLVANGGFEVADSADPRRPTAWDLPDGLGVQWASGEKSSGRAIWLDTRISEVNMVRQWQTLGLTNIWNIPKPAPNAIADTYGLSFYSAPFAVASGCVYRVRCDTYGAGGVKVWVRGYGMFRGRLTKRYEAMMNCNGRAGEWTPQAMEFNPTRHRPEVTEMRVMLYAYYPPRRYGFDNVVVEPVLPADSGDEALAKPTPRAVGVAPDPCP